MIDADAIIIVQADTARCGAICGFLDFAPFCRVANMLLSSHRDPEMHLDLCCAVPRAIHMECFRDHARIERICFDGFRELQGDLMEPDLSRPGMGIELKDKDAATYLA